jgi:hypothetical protein
LVLSLSFVFCHFYCLSYFHSLSHSPLFFHCRFISFLFSLFNQLFLFSSFILWFPTLQQFSQSV